MDCSICKELITGTTWTLKGFDEEMIQEYDFMEDGMVHLCQPCYEHLLDQCDLEELQEMMRLLVRKQ